MTPARNLRPEHPLTRLDAEHRIVLSMTRQQIRDEVNKPGSLLGKACAFYTYAFKVAYGVDLLED